MKKKIIILGAGPVGLVTGWLLSKKNWDVEIYEKNSIVGGMCRSWKWKDFILDTGPHIFHTPDKKMWDFWQKNFGKLLEKGKYWSKNTYKNDFKVFYDYPLSLESINKFPKEFKSKIINEIKNLKHKKKKLSTNFDEHVKNQVGETLTKMFFKDYPEKVWGMNTNDITSEWAPKRIKFRKKILPFFSGEYTAVGKYGTGSIYEHIKSQIKKNGGKIYLNKCVTNFKKKDRSLVGLKFLDGKKIKINPETEIISTLPITLTARLLGIKNNLKFRGVRTIYVEIKKRTVLPNKCHWVYYSSKEIIFNRVSEPKKMSKYVSPKNKTYLSVEMTYEKGDQIDRLNFSKIKKIVKEDLIKSFLVKEDDIGQMSENKEDFVYPVQFVNYKYNLTKVNSKIAKYNQLYSLGTGGEFNYADSQILFHKSMDLVDVLDSKFAKKNQVSKPIEFLKFNPIVKLGKFYVGDNYPTYIIAEAGLNHNGDIETAKKLILEAKKCGCNSIKFQSFDADRRISKNVKSAKYAEEADGLQENIHEMFKRLSLNKKETRQIFNFARKEKIEVFSTPFDENQIDLLEELDVNFYKIASVDLVNLPLLEKVSKTKKPVILSTGMSTLSNIEDAVDIFRKNGNNNLILLHCLSSYPANENEMNLNVIKTLKRNYNIPVGLSDHYPGLEITLLSIGLGANIIERHFTLDRKFEGPDHILSSEPEEMKKLVDIAKNSQTILGDGYKRIQPSEYFTINSQRKSLFAKTKIKKGEKILDEKIIIKGPGGGILPKYIDLVLNRKVKKDILPDHPIEWENI